VGSNDKGIFKVDLSNRIKFLEASFGLKELQISRDYITVQTILLGWATDNILQDKDLEHTILDKKRASLKKNSRLF
jgi:hypothetical protein